MDDLDRELLSIEPSQEYLDFVGKYLLQQPPQDTYDPFALIPKGPEDDWIIDRPEAEKLIYLPGNRIISGRRGAGKATLCLKSNKHPMNDGVFTVPLTLSANDLDNNQPLTGDPERLLQPMVSTLWSNLESDLKADRLAFENPDPAWLPILCWFRKQYPPPPDTSQLAQLDSWCDTITSFPFGDPFRDLVRLVTEYRTKAFNGDRTALRQEIVRCFSIDDLKNFLFDHNVEYESIPRHDDVKESFAREIVARFERYGRLNELIEWLQRERPGINWSSVDKRRNYEYLRFLINTPSTASEVALCHLIEDAIALSLKYQRVFGTVFIGDYAYRATRQFIADRDAKLEPEIYRLLDWNPNELRKLLEARLNFVMHGEWDGQHGPKPNPFDQIKRHILPADPEKFLHIVTSFACDVYSHHDPSLMDAPVHALSLMRILLTACSGRWTEYGFRPPIAPRQLDTLCTRYWEARRAQTEEKDA